MRTRSNKLENVETRFFLSLVEQNRKKSNKVKTVGNGRPDWLVSSGDYDNNRLERALEFHDFKTHTRL